MPWKHYDADRERKRNQERNWRKRSDPNVARLEFYLAGKTKEDAEYLMYAWGFPSYSEMARTSVKFLARATRAGLKRINVEKDE